MAVALATREPQVAEQIVGLADQYADAIVTEVGIDPDLHASMAGAFLAFLTDVSEMIGDAA